MFDMKKHAGGNAGYRFNITYRAETGIHTLAAYIVHDANVGGGIDYIQDGQLLHFGSLEEVLNYITESE